MARTTLRLIAGLLVAALVALAAAFSVLQGASRERAQLARVVSLVAEHDAQIIKLASATRDLAATSDPARRATARTRATVGLANAQRQHVALLAGDAEIGIDARSIQPLSDELAASAPAFDRLLADAGALLRISEPLLDPEHELELVLSDSVEQAAEDYTTALRGAVLPLRQQIDADGGSTTVIAAILSGFAVLALGAVGLVVARWMTRTAPPPVADADAEEMRLDELTGLANRALFRDRLDHALAGAERANSQFAVMFLDLDRFKMINDRFGHDVGDGVLVEFAKRLSSCARRSDTVARLGGDEFTLLLENLEGSEGAATVAEKILSLVEEPVLVGEHNLSIGTSIGIALWPDDAREVGDLLRNADTAMYAAKAAGRGNYQFSTPALRASNVRRLRLIEQIRTAIDEDDLRLVYQPQVSMATGGVIAVEALVRWQQAGELVPAAEWLPVIEHTELAVPLAGWVMRTACRQLQAWEEAGLDLRVTVNISKRQFRHVDLPETVATVLAATGVDPRRLELELTEDAVAEDVESAAETMAALKALGVRIALDDFGTGMVSIKSLRALPIDTLKIDRTFVDTVDKDETVVAGAIAGLAQHFSMEAVAEGVETESQWAFLHGIDVDRAQGYLVTGALNADEIPAFVRRRRITAVG